MSDDLRELDAWIAENAMGWSVAGIDQWGLMLPTDVPHFTTDPRAADLVLWRMWDRGHPYLIERIEGGFIARFYESFRHDDRVMGSCSDAQSWPEAVCRAAKAALEGRV